MILDKIDYLEHYRSMIPCLDAVKAFLEKADGLPVGRYDMDGGYVLVQEGATRPGTDALFEAHHQYIDLQLVCMGSEQVEWADIKDLQEQASYDEKSDAVFYSGKGVPVAVTKGHFYLLLPHDAHKSCCHMDKPGTYKKIVFKYPVFQ